MTTQGKPTLTISITDARRATGPIGRDHTILCADCGARVHTTSPRRLYCVECGEQRREARDKARGK